MAPARRRAPLTKGSIMNVQTVAHIAPVAAPVGTGASISTTRAPKAPKAPRKPRKAPVTVSFTTESLTVACKAPNAKEFRRWLRAHLRANGAASALAGKGGRYAFTSAQGALIVKAYGERKAHANSTAAGEAFERLARKAPKA